MQIVNKGTPPKGYLYLVCDNARRKVSNNSGKGIQKCRYISVRYHVFEDKFFEFCSEVDIKELMNQIAKNKNDKFFSALNKTATEVLDSDEDFIAVFNRSLIF